MVFGKIISHRQAHLVVVSACTAALKCRDVIHVAVVKTMVRVGFSCLVRISVVVRVHEVDAHLLADVHQTGTFLKRSVVTLVVNAEHLTCEPLFLCRLMQEVYVYARTSYIIFGRCVIHYLHICESVFWYALQHLRELFLCKVCYLSVQYHRGALSAKRQLSVHFHHARQFLQRIVCVVYRLLFGYSFYVIHQCAAFYLHHGAFAAHHHFRQIVYDAVHPQRIVGCCSLCRACKR